MLSQKAFSTLCKENTFNNENIDEVWRGFKEFE